MKRFCWLALLACVLTAGSARAAAADEQSQFKAAKQAFTDGLFDISDSRFGAFLKKYPDSDLKAEVRSISAVGEYYVDLRPRTDSPPYLHDGSVIAMNETTLPQPIGPVQSASAPNGLPAARCSRPADQEALRIRQLVDFVAQSRAMAVQNPLLLADVGYYEAELAASRRCLQAVAAR